MIPEDLRYTAEHEWVSGDGSGPVRVGITDFAQEALGDIVFVQLPEEGATVTAGDTMGEVESINAEPYAAGWLVEIAPDDPAAVSGLLDAAAYGELTKG